MKAHRSFIIIVLCLLLLTACNLKINRLRRQQFDILRKNVVELLGDEYRIKKIRIKNEEYCDNDPTKYVVEFGFDLANQHDTIPSDDIPGKLVFDRKNDGSWQCSFSTAELEKLRIQFGIPEEESKNATQ